LPKVKITNNNTSNKVEVAIVNDVTAVIGLSTYFYFSADGHLIPTLAIKRI